MLCSRSSTFRSAVTFLLLFVVKSTKAEKLTSFNQISLSIPHPAFESSPLIEDEEPSAARIRRSASALATTGADVDRIQSIEVEPTQLTITTTKQGELTCLQVLCSCFLFRPSGISQNSHRTGRSSGQSNSATNRSLWIVPRRRQRFAFLFPVGFQVAGAEEEAPLAPIAPLLTPH